MIYRVYKSLDNPASMFGIKGSYIYYVGAGALVSALLGVAVGIFTNSFVGFLVFVLGLVLSYLGTMVFQARFSERERKRWLSSRALPDVVVLPPKRFAEIAEGSYRKAEERKQNAAES